MNNSILNMLYRGTTTIQDFNWDMMTTTPILSLMTVEDISQLKRIILSPRYSGNNRLKTSKIDEIMHFRGFKKFAGGTNRLVYIHPSAPNAVFKVAIDSIGINDNPTEYRNQQFIKPYCCKVFECSPCGTIASFEKVERITTFEEFYSIADDYFYILSKIILGKYVMEDIGINYFMNVGIRKGCHPVILDFPYLFELDGKKLECANQLDDGTICHGEIDYDAGFNNLVCKKCGKVYRAKDLAKPPEKGGILLKDDGGDRMTVVITKGDKIIHTSDNFASRDHLNKNDHINQTSVKSNATGIKVVITGGTKKNITENKQSEEVKNIQTNIQKANKDGYIPVTIDLGFSKKPVIETSVNTSTETFVPKVTVSNNRTEVPKMEDIINTTLKNDPIAVFAAESIKEFINNESVKKTDPIIESVITENPGDINNNIIIDAPFTETKEESSDYNEEAVKMMEEASITIPVATVDIPNKNSTIISHEVELAKPEEMIQGIIFEDNNFEEKEEANNEDTCKVSSDSTSIEDNSELNEQDDEDELVNNLIARTERAKLVDDE